MKKFILVSLVFCLLAGSAALAENSAGAPAAYSRDDQFTDRDLKQEADLDEAISCIVSNGEDIRISSAGIYVLTGSASDVTVYVEADKEDKVQLVLDGVSLVNEDFPCIYVKKADKVFLTVSADSSLSVTGSFRADGDTDPDGVIFSRTDLVLNGTAQLTLSSPKHGVVCKDTLKATGGTWEITAAKKALEANDSIRIAGGTFRLNAGTDGLSAGKKNGGTPGYIYICGGRIAIEAGDDGIHAASVLQIDDGELAVTAAEGLEATWIRINGGTLTVSAQANGINASQKSDSYIPTVEFNGGETAITMVPQDSDAVDSNGDIFINAGTLSLAGGNAFKYGRNAVYSGGTVIINGEEVSSIPD